MRSGELVSNDADSTGASDAKTSETSSSVDSQIKDSSNSFRRRHSSEGVDAKFSSTLPKDSAVVATPNKN